MGWWRADSAPLLAWRKKFKDNYKFYAGDQSDAPSTREKKQIIFNRVRPIIDAVCGAQLASPRDIVAIPRVPPADSANEKADGASDLLKWFREKGRAAEAEAQAFRDALVGGVGFISVNLDWQRDKNGAPVYEALNPLEMAWPADSWETNLRSAKRLWRITWHEMDSLKDMFGNIDESRYGFPCGEEWGKYRPSGAVKSGEVDEANKIYCLAELRLMERSGSIWIDDNGQSHVCEPADIISVEVPQYIPVRYWLGADGKPLKKKSPVLATNHSLGWHALTCNSITGENTFFGIVDGMIDAQKLLNRMVSQTLYTFDRQSKGGYLAEQNVFENPQQAEKDLASNDKIVYVKAGALSQGRLQPRHIDPVNDSLIALYKTADDAFTHLSGVSDEFMGTREAVQAGILEQERKDSTMNVLGVPFTNLKNLRLASAEDIIYLGKHWVSDNLLVRVDRQFKRVSRADLNSDYDLYLNDAPSGDNEKAAVMERILRLLPALAQLRQAGASDKILAKIIKYSPFPSGFIEEIDGELETDGDAEQSQQQAEQQQSEAQQQDIALSLAQKKAALDSQQLDNAAKEKELRNAG